MRTSPHVPQQGHHVTFGLKMERYQGQHVLGARFGLHNWANLHQMPRPHRDSVWDAVYMVAKEISELPMAPVSCKNFI
jgi:hypothetical protein